jgi:hypothetical protein
VHLLARAVIEEHVMAHHDLKHTTHEFMLEPHSKITSENSSGRLYPPPQLKRRRKKDLSGAGPGR